MNWRRRDTRGKLVAARDEGGGMSRVNPWQGRLPGMLFLAALLAGPLPAQALGDRPLLRGTVAFDGRGTLGAFTGATDSVRGMLTGGAELEAVRGWVEADAATLATGNDRRDRDMWKSLEVERFPMLRFELEGVGAGEASGDSVPVTVRGHFTIHGVARELAVRGWVWPQGATVRFRGTTPMNLKDYEIGGLRKMLGMLKMHEEITVRVDLEF